jgi:23S rRNA pseudouridine1911/1915/1917 synthase
VDRRPGGAGAVHLELPVLPGEAGDRLDVFLGRRAEVGSRSRAAALIKAGAVLVDGAPALKSRPLTAGQTVTVDIPSASASPLTPEPIPVPVVFEDDWLLVVDKPAGMAVHPSRGHSAGTLVHALLGHGLAGGEEYRPGVVHRLDKDTSGLLVVAKNEEVHRALVGLMRRRAVDRRYLALVHAGFRAASGTIEAPVGRDPGRRKTMTVGGVGAREARTHFVVVERLNAFTLVEARLETGRTHQIRVHFLAIGHPVAGDPLYGRRDPLGLGRQFLHSHRLAFVHPVTGEHLEFESPLPEALVAALRGLREEARS